jgi:NAD-dependent SIR2 family protein deacetylase
MEEQGAYGLRKRRRTQRYVSHSIFNTYAIHYYNTRQTNKLNALLRPSLTNWHSGRESSEGNSLDTLLAAAQNAENIVVFSGSGLSASSGMSTFSTKGGLYEKAQKLHKLTDGKQLFTYQFFDRRRSEATAFFADIWKEAQHAKPAPGHTAIAALASHGKLRRHYTLNIDGLSSAVGMDTWHHETNPDGTTVEMHGNIHHLVCAECFTTKPVDRSIAEQLGQMQPIPCPVCPLENNKKKEEEQEDQRRETEEAGSTRDNHQEPINNNNNMMRFKVMLYEDAESDCITPDEVLDLLEEDIQAADLILWVGISFEQSASTAYFRRVRHTLAEAGKLDSVPQAVINPSEDALWNILTSMSNLSTLRVMEVLAPSDEVLPALVNIGSKERDEVVVVVGKGEQEEEDE